MAGSYSCDDQTRIHESKEGIPFIALRIKLTFLALKKVVQVVQNGGLGGGGVEVIWKISKKNLLFFVKPSLRTKSIN